MRKLETNWSLTYPDGSIDYNSEGTPLRLHAEEYYTLFEPPNHPMWRYLDCLEYGSGVKITLFLDQVSGHVQVDTQTPGNHFKAISSRLTFMNLNLLNDYLCTFDFAPYGFITALITRLQRNMK